MGLCKFHFYTSHHQPQYLLPRRTNVALTGPKKQQVLQLMMSIIELRLAQTHVALTGPKRQQVLRLMMTCIELKLAQIHVAVTGPKRQEVLQQMMNFTVFQIAKFRNHNEVL